VAIHIYNPPPKKRNRSSYGNILIYVMESYSVVYDIISFTDFVWLLHKYSCHAIDSICNNIFKTVVNIRQHQNPTPLESQLHPNKESIILGEIHVLTAVNLLVMVHYVVWKNLTSVSEVLTVSIKSPLKCVVRFY
jgi:hypothetical protein